MAYLLHESTAASLINSLRSKQGELAAYQTTSEARKTKKERKGKKKIKQEKQTRRDSKVRQLLTGKLSEIFKIFGIFFSSKSHLAAFIHLQNKTMLITAVVLTVEPHIQKH